MTASVFLLHELPPKENFRVLIVIEQSGEGTALMDAWSKSDDVYLVDAVSSAAPPGAVYRIDARTKPLPNDLHPFSSHAFGVAHAVELARRLNTLPPKLILFGVGGKSFDSGKEFVT